MKRKLSLLLAVVMILSSFSFVFADEDFNVPAFLEKNGILKGDTTGDLMLDQPLLRKDAVVLFARLLGKEAEAESFEMEGYPTFTDLAGNPYYDAFLAWAEYNEYFVGRPDGSFGYNDNLEAIESAIVLLRALGYTEEAADWDNAWETAKKLGLLKDIEVERRDLILREDVAQMIFNALGVEMKEEGITLAEFLGIELPEEPKPEKLEVVDVYAENLMEVEVELSNADLAKADLENPDNYRVINYPGIVEKAELIDNNVRLTLSKALTNNRTYELLIRGLDKELNGTYEFDVLDNTVPEVVDAVALGEYGIKVTTSEPVKEPQERFFLLDGKNVAMVVEQYGRDIILRPYHNRSFGEGEAVLTVKSLTDYAGFKSTSVDFDIVIEKDEEAPVAVGAEAREKEIIVEFDKDVYEPSVAKGNAVIQIGRNKIEATKAEKVDTNKVKYTFDRAFSDRASLTVKGVQNHSKVKMEEAEVDVVIVKDNLEPEVVYYDIFFLEGNDVRVELVFDEYLKEEANGSVKLYKDEVKAANEVELEKEDVEIDVEGNEVTILIKGLKVDTDYILEVEGFEDLAGNEMFVYYVDFTIPGVKTKSKIINILTDYVADEIEIRFNNPVDREFAEVLENYVIILANESEADLKELGGYVIVENDGYTVTLVVPGLNKDEHKSIRIAELKDKDGKRIEKVASHNLDELFGPLVTRAEKAIEKAGTNFKDEVKAVEEALVGNKNENADKLQKAVEALEKALDDAEKAAKKDAKKALEALIEEAEELYEEIEVAELLKAIRNAEKVLNDDKATSEDLNEAIEALEEAIEAAREEAAAKAVEALIAALPEVKDITADNLEEVREKAIEARKAYEALTEEQQKLVTNLPTLEEVEAKIEALDEEAAEEQELESAKEELSKAIEEAEKLLEEAKEILDEENDKVKELGNAINAAKVAVYEAKNIEEVESAKDELKSAMKAAEIEKAKKALEDKIAEAEALVEADYGELDVEKEVGALNTAISEAKQLLEDEDATVDSLEEALAALEEAIETFEEAVHAKKLGSSSMTNFNTHSGTDYKGVNVGFKLEDGIDFDKISSIMVNLYSEEGRLIASNKAIKDKHKELYTADQIPPVREFSTPFIVQEGTYKEEYWILGEWTPDVNKKPAKAELVIVDSKGNVYKKVNNSLSEDTARWESLFNPIGEETDTN